MRCFLVCTFLFGLRFDFLQLADFAFGGSWAYIDIWVPFQVEVLCSLKCVRFARQECSRTQTQPESAIYIEIGYIKGHIYERIYVKRG